MASISPALTAAAADHARPSTATPAAADSLIDQKEVIRRTGLSRSTIDKLIRAGTFPARVKVTAAATRFSAKAVDAWIQDRIAASHGIAMIAQLAAVVLAAVSVIASVFLARALHQTRAQMWAARREVVTLLEQVAAAQADADRLRATAEDQVRFRAEDLQLFHGHVRELRENYDRVIRQYQRAYTIEGPLASRRIQ